MAVYQKVNNGTLLSKIKNDLPIDKKLKIVINQMRTIMSCDHFQNRRYNSVAYIEHNFFHQYADEIFEENNIRNRIFDSDHNYLIYYNEYYIKDKMYATPGVKVTSFKHYDDMYRLFKFGINDSINGVKVEIDFNNHFMTILLNGFILLKYNMTLFAIGIIKIDDVIEMLYDICNNEDVIKVFRVLADYKIINNYSLTPINNLSSVNKLSFIYNIIKNIDKYKMITDYKLMMKSYNQELFTKLKLLCKSISLKNDDMEKLILTQRFGPFKVDIKFNPAKYYRHFSWLYEEGCEDGALIIDITLNRARTSFRYGLNEDSTKCKNIETGIISYILTNFTGHKAFMNQLNQKILA